MSNVLITDYITNPDIENNVFKDTNYKVVTFRENFDKSQVEGLLVWHEIIDSKFLNVEDYGVFYVFHKSKDQLNSSIRQSCYTGYSLNNNTASFVHGNTPTALKKINSEDKKLFFGLGGKHIFLNKTF